MAAHYSLIHSNDQTAWLSTRRICPITTLPFLTLITRQMTWNLPFHPQCEWLLKSMISCGVTIWMKHLWWHFHSALFIFQREIWKCCWLIFLILVTIETNPVINLNISKLVTQVLGNILNFLIWKGTTSCICCGSILSLIYIYLIIIVSNSWPCHYHSLPYPKKQKKNNEI